MAPNSNDDSFWTAALAAAKNGKSKIGMRNTMETQPSHHSGVGLQRRVAETIVPEYKSVTLVPWPGTDQTTAKSTIDNISEKGFLTHDLFIQGKGRQKGPYDR